MHRGKAGLVAALTAGVALMVGCSDKKESATPPASAPAAATEQPVAAEGSGITPEVRAEAEKIFANRCTPCHGPQGAGDGPASAGLTPRPRNFTDKAWQSSVTDEHIERIISYGGAAVGRSPAMPPNPDLADKPEVKALRELIRGLGK